MTDPGEGQQKPAEGDEPELNFRDSLTAAMRKSGLGQVEPGEVPTAKALLGAIGGIRGLVEAIVPGVGFLVIFTLTHNVVAAVVVPVALAVVFLLIRIVTRSGPTQALSGLAVLAVSALLALKTGRAEDNFLFGLGINAVSLLVLLVSLLVRWPLIGIVVGFLTNEITAWRHDRAKRRVLVLATWLWVGLFAVRLAVEVPLYLAENTALLATARLVLGIPFYAVVLWLTWMLVRAAYGRAKATPAV